MDSNQIVDAILESINQIVSSRLESLPYDKTLICTIVDDSEKENFIYTVQEGSVKFKARALDNKKYSVNQQVCVKIPLGDMTSNKKIIEGIFVSDTNNTLNLLTAKDKFIDVGQYHYVVKSSLARINSESKEFFYIPIGDEVPGELFKFSASNYAFNTLYVSAKFKTQGLTDVKTGRYGIAVELYNANGDAMGVFVLDNLSDMFGDTYNFTFPMRQEQIYSFDLDPNMPIAGIKLRAYQLEGWMAGLSPDAQIEVSDISLSFGFDTNKLKDSLELIHNGSLEYNGSFNKEEYRDIKLFWYHYVDNKYVPLSDCIYDEEESKKIRGVISDISTSTGKVSYFIEGLSLLDAFVYDNYLERDGEKLEIGDVVYYNLQEKKIETEELPKEGTYYSIEWYATNEYDTLEPIEREYSPEDIKENKPREYSVKCQPTTNTTEVTAALWVNGVEYKPNEPLVFKNLTPQAQTFIDLSQIKVQVLHQENSKPSYPLYDGLMNMLINPSEGWTRRTVKFSFSGRDIGPEFWEGSEIIWTIPKENTMLLPYGDEAIEEEDGYKTKKKIEVTKDKDGVVIGLANIDCSYKINNNYFASATNNTIRCEVTVCVGAATARVEGAIDFSFSTFGASGTDYTIVFKPLENKTISIAVLDKNGEVVDNAPIEWKANWLEKAEWKSYEKGKPSTEKCSTNTYNLLEARAKVEHANQQVWVYGYYGIATGRDEYAAIIPASIVYENTGSNPSYYQGTLQLFNKDGEVPNVTWNIISNHGKNGELPTIKNGKVVAPTAYLEGIKCSFEAKINGEGVFYYPIYIGINRHQSELFNNWDGAMLIKENENYILTSMLSAGRKEDDNSFTGFTIGDIGKINQQGNLYDTTTGIFGYHAGVNTYRFETNGNAYIGDGNQFIQFNADEKSNEPGLRIKTKDINVVAGEEKENKDYNGNIISKYHTFVLNSNPDLNSENEDEKYYFRMGGLTFDGNAINMEGSGFNGVTGEWVEGVKIGGFEVGSNYIRSNNSSSPLALYSSYSGGFSPDEPPAGATGSWRIIVGKNFGVDDTGSVYAPGITINSFTLPGTGGNGASWIINENGISSEQSRENNWIKITRDGLTVYNNNYFHNWSKDIPWLWLARFYELHENDL